MIDYELKSTEELVELARTNHNDGAAYYLIMVTCRPLLCGIMNNAGVEEEAQYDVLMDFFLYLRDGNKKVEDDKLAFTYQLFLTINNPSTFNSWVRTVFVRFMNKKLATQKNFREIEDYVADDETFDGYSLEDLHTAILLFEEVNECFSAPERYVFFSDMYALYSEENVTSEMARVLNCTINNVRVMRSRVKAKVRKLVDEIKKGGKTWK